ncbi:hypothetical protein [Terricaulis sp.]|uniref:hypothetical protein n=1 Tax=Terricaulis sp. TaxID=2768686 RepID=UPI0037845637
MMLFIWTAVMMQMFLPAGGQITALQAKAYEDHLRAQLETPAPTSLLFGAAQHVTHYAMPKLSRVL